MRIKSTGFTYNNKHSSAFDIRITDINLPLPESKEIRETVPHMNGDYDFTNAYGPAKFNNRKITIDGFVIPEINQRMMQLKREIETWLYNVGWLELTIDYDEEYYYIAKCISCTCKLNVKDKRLEINIEFEAKPKAISKLDGRAVL